MAEFDPDTPPYVPSPDTYEPDGQVTEPDASAATGRPNDLQVWFRGLGLSSRKLIQQVPTLAPLKAIAQEVTALRTFPDALGPVGLSLGGKAEVRDPDTGALVSEFAPGLVHVFFGFDAYERLDGSTEPAFDGVLGSLPGAFRDASQVREALFGPVDAAGVPTGPGELQRVRERLDSVETELLTRLDAINTTLADGFASVAQALATQQVNVDLTTDVNIPPIEVHCDCSDPAP